jgi:hypothetical protein
MKAPITVDEKVEEVSRYLRNSLSDYAEKYPEKYDIIAHRFVQLAEKPISTPETAQKILNIASRKNLTYDIFIDNLLTDHSAEYIAQVLMP